MFPELNEILDINSTELPLGSFYLISDYQTDGSFLVDHFNSLFLKGGGNVCFLGLAQSFNHYNSVGNKIGISLSQARENGQLIFIEGLKEICQSMLGDNSAPYTTPFQEGGLRALYQTMKSKLTVTAANGNPTLILIDDLAPLLSLGVAWKDLVQFVNYLRVLGRGYNCCLVTLLHCDKDAEDDEAELLWKRLCHDCNLTLEAHGLKSGYCKDVHGEVIS